MKDHNRVSIIILNWNGWKDTIECLESLYRITNINFDVVVVDNGSKDESIEKITKYCEGKIKIESDFFEFFSITKPIEIIECLKGEIITDEKKKIIFSLLPNKKLILIKNEKNYGFAEGNNIGIRFALNNLEPNYILILNNDTIVDSRFLCKLIETINIDDRIWSVGPKTYYYHQPEIINFAGGKLNFWKGESYHIGFNELDSGQYDVEREVDYIEGSCLLARVEVIKKIGLLDNKYFSYWEDTDWCVRAHKNGYKALYVPSAKIWHKVYGSTGATLNPTVVYYRARNRLLFMRKNASIFYFIPFIIYLFFNIPFEMGAYLFKKRINLIKAYLRGIVSGTVSSI
ncbi:putative glycosyltransferase [Thermoplasmatales archaeon SCGC AB-539-C06]|nr:putative glycosyltransferase [Thermoplasmatales archaeon SCGC AB-539-C06]